MFFFYLYFLIIFTKNLIFAEVLTFKNEENVSCVLTEDSVYSPVYISSTTSKYSFVNIKRPSVELNRWVHYDWKLTNSHRQRFGPVTDIRWEDFGNIKNGTIKLNPNGTTSFSVCFMGKTLMFTAINDRMNTELVTLSRKQENQQVCQWSHYMFHEQHIFGDDGTFTLSFIPTEFIFPQKIQGIKVHNYDFRYSLETTLSDQISFVDLANLSNASFICLSMYVSVDQGCYLDISLESTTIKTVHIDGFNNKTQPKTWKRVEINAAYDGTGKLNFFRTRRDDHRAGFWAVGKIQLCRPKIETYSILAGSEGLNYNCRTLSSPRNVTNTLPCTPCPSKNNCTLNCETIGEKYYSSCEKYEFCFENGTCRSLKGYHGLYCEQNLNGMDDKIYNIPKNCEKFNKTSGCTKCKNQFFGNQCSRKLPVVSEPPELIKIDNDGIEIDLKGLNYANGEAKPDFYQIQYKEANITFWKNFSTPVPYDSTTISKNIKIENLSTTEFEYNIRVLLFVKNQSFDNKIPELLTHRKSKPVKNFSIYRSTTDAFWIRWQNSSPHLIEFFKINSQVFSQNFSFPCKYWKDFSCARIKMDGFSTPLAMQVKNYNFSEWSDAEISQNLRDPKISDSPSNVRLAYSVQPNEIILKWEHPLYTYGSLPGFTVEIDDGGSKISKWVKLNESGNQYEEKISVEENHNYTISVWGESSSKSKKTDLDVRILFPLFELSSKPMVEWCNEKCFLLVPNDNHVNFEMMVLKTHGEKNKDEIKTIYDNMKNGDQKEDEWLVEFETSSPEFLKAEIGDSAPKAVSTESQTHNMYFIYNDDFSSNFEAFPVQFNVKERFQVNKKEETTLNKYFIYGFLAVFSVLVVLVLVAFVCFRKKFWKKPRSQQHEEVSLMDMDGTDDLSRTINLEKLETHLKNFLKNSDEFYSIPNEKMETCSEALKPENVTKNKDKIYIPYDLTRVELENQDAMAVGDYINANYIDGYRKPKSYIASQGPKFSTVLDFWRMIWQKQVKTIIMAANFSESDGNRNCAEYWNPHLNTDCQYGEIIVKMTTEYAYQSYDYRIFEIQCRGDTRKINHFQLKWEHDEVFYPDDILPVLKYMREIAENSVSPIVVHSGSGVNRCGVLILCDMAIEMIEIEKKINFGELLRCMRKQRAHMLENFEYYKLAQLAVLEYFMNRESPFEKSLDEVLSTDLIKDQISFLERLYWHDELVQEQKKPSTEYEYFLEKIYVDSYQKRNQFIICPIPQKKYLKHFWTIIMNQNIKYLLFPNSVENKMWPFKFENSEIIFSVTQLNVVQVAPFFYTTRLSLHMSDTKTKKVLNKTEHWVYELRSWDSKQSVPKWPQDVLDMIQHVKSAVKENDNPFIVMTCDGSNSGHLFAILFFVLEKYETELEIDVCKAVRTVKRCDKNFVLEPEQLKFIYTAVVEYFKRHDQYNHIYNSIAKSNHYQ